MKNVGLIKQIVAILISLLIIFSYYQKHINKNKSLIINDSNVQIKADLPYILQPDYENFIIIEKSNNNYDIDLLYKNNGKLQSEFEIAKKKTVGNNLKVFLPINKENAQIQYYIIIFNKNINGKYFESETISAKYNYKPPIILNLINIIAIFTIIYLSTFILFNINIVNLHLYVNSIIITGLTSLLIFEPLINYFVNNSFIEAFPFFKYSLSNSLSIYLVLIYISFFLKVKKNHNFALIIVISSFLISSIISYLKYDKIIKFETEQSINA